MGKDELQSQVRPHHLQNEERWVGVAEPSDDTHLARLTAERVCPVPGGWRVVGVGAPEAAGSRAWVLFPASDNKGPSQGQSIRGGLTLCLLCEAWITVTPR